MVILEQLCIHYVQPLSCVDNHGCYMDNGIGQRSVRGWMVCVAPSLADPGTFSFHLW